MDLHPDQRVAWQAERALHEPAFGALAGLQGPGMDAMAIRVETADLIACGFAKAMQAKESFVSRMLRPYRVSRRLGCGGHGLDVAGEAGRRLV